MGVEGRIQVTLLKNKKNARAGIRTRVTAVAGPYTTTILLVHQLVVDLKDPFDLTHRYFIT